MASIVDWNQKSPSRANARRDEWWLCALAIEAVSFCEAKDTSGERGRCEALKIVSPQIMPRWENHQHQFKNQQWKKKAIFARTCRRTGKGEKNFLNYGLFTPTVLRNQKRFSNLWRARTARQTPRSNRPSPE